MVGQTIDTLIYERSMDGFGRCLKDFYPTDLPIVLQPGRMELRALARQKKEIKYPFFAINVNRIAETKDRYNPFALRTAQSCRRPYKLGAPRTAQSCRRLLKMLPSVPCKELPTNLDLFI